MQESTKDSKYVGQVSTEESMDDSAHGTTYERVYVGLNVTTCECFHMGEAMIPQFLLHRVVATLHASEMSVAPVRNIV